MSGSLFPLQFSCSPSQAVRSRTGLFFSFQWYYRQHFTAKEKKTNNLKEGEGDDKKEQVEREIKKMEPRERGESRIRELDCPQKRPEPARDRHPSPTKTRRWVRCLALACLAGAGWMLWAALNIRWNGSNGARWLPWLQGSLCTLTDHLRQQARVPL
ncbi:hypothetical protein GE21DRAFT_1349920 [Neurospora crassa]|nr:hypothetical protein B21J21.80 [imported] - Neurospora crassa [Neurospora crassa]KHE84897.1 hypothetical protein GE21DRAFT_1349920 [Neurospora crassa]